MLTEKEKIFLRVASAITRFIICALAITVVILLYEKSNTHMECSKANAAAAAGATPANSLPGNGEYVCQRVSDK